MALRYYVSSEEAPFFVNNKMGSSDRIPTSGTYKVGDFIISNTQADGIFGWVCTVAGTPGTWIEIGSGGGSNTKTLSLSSSTVVSSPVREVAIGIKDFNKNTDFLMVYKNSTYLTEGVDYDISSDSTKIVSRTGNWNADSLGDYRFSFVVIKEVEKVNPEAVVGTENIKDSVVTMSKLGEDVIERLDGFDSQLEHNANETRSKRLQGENKKTDSKGTFDSANFAGQDLGKDAPIGNVMHHYTDGTVFQIDNVGEGNNILLIKNAYNPSRRPDKPNNFIGTGDFINCINAVHDAPSKSVFIVNREGDFIFKNKDTPTQFITNKEDNNDTCFRFRTYKEHNKLLEVMNGGLWEVTLSHLNDKCVIQSGNKLTSGMLIDAQLGNLDLKSTTGDINLFANKSKGNVDVYGVLRVQEGTSDYNRVVTVRSGSTEGRPTDGLYIGKMYLDTSLGHNGKVIWWNGDNWIDAMGNIV